MPQGRESTMPPVELWDSFFDCAGILDALGCRDVKGDLIEFGCGYGSFTVAAATRVAGTVYALDIDPPMVAATAARARQGAHRNVDVERRDFVGDGAGRPSGSVAFGMLFNILHIEEPVLLLREAHRVIRPGGVLGVIHWKRDVPTPRGPSLDIRPRPEDCRAWGELAGFRWVRYEELPGSPWHWGMVLERPGPRRAVVGASVVIDSRSRPATPF